MGDNLDYNEWYRKIIGEKRDLSDRLFHLPVSYEPVPSSKLKHDSEAYVLQHIRGAELSGVEDEYHSVLEFGDPESMSPEQKMDLMASLKKKDEVVKGYEIAPNSDYNILRAIYDLNLATLDSIYELLNAIHRKYKSLAISDLPKDSKHIENRMRVLLKSGLVMAYKPEMRMTDDAVESLDRVRYHLRKSDWAYEVTQAGIEFMRRKCPDPYITYRRQFSPVEDPGKRMARLAAQYVTTKVISHTDRFLCFENPYLFLGFTKNSQLKAPNIDFYELDSVIRLERIAPSSGDMKTNTDKQKECVLGIVSYTEDYSNQTNTKESIRVARNFWMNSMIEFLMCNRLSQDRRLIIVLEDFEAIRTLGGFLASKLNALTMQNDFSGRIMLTCEGILRCALEENHPITWGMFTIRRKEQTGENGEKKVGYAVTRGAVNFLLKDEF